MPLGVRELLDLSRKELLDLSTRNRLLSIPVSSKSARIVQVEDEFSEQVFRLLVTEQKALAFLPGRRVEGSQEDLFPESADEADKEEVELSQPGDEKDEATGLARRHVDLGLQTKLSSEGLQRRLLNLYRDSEMMIEEQGINILYLALGHLKWFEVEHTDEPRFAPLILIPVELERRTASERFRIRWREEDIEGNLSLEAKLKADFSIEMPPFPEEEEFSPDAYFSAVAKAIAGAKGWEVLPNAITLGFFSFAKFLMYRDLDPNNWPSGDKLLKHPLITGLLQDGFPEPDSLLSEDTDIDELIPASKLDHVVDADSSQTLAIEMVRQGRNLVIQGPPGTGKSQSITNIIATAVLDGKKVLFVAEKLDALKVVKRRLEKEGLGPLCLELHSNKANKRAVIEEIGRTWRLGRPKPENLGALVPQLEQRRAILNTHSKTIHERLSPSGLTPYLIMGQIAVLGDRGRELADVKFDGAENWTSEDRVERRRLAEELAKRVQQIGTPAKHPWRGVCREAVLNIDFPPLERQIHNFLNRLSDLQDTSRSLATAMSQPIPETLDEIDRQRIVSEYVAKAPPVDKEALCNSVWNAGLEGIHDLLAEGQRYSDALESVGKRVVPSTWEQDFSTVRTLIAAHGRSCFRLLNSRYRGAISQLRGVLTGRLPKSYVDRIALIDSILQGQAALHAIRAGNMSGQSAFGHLWRAEKTDWKQLQAVLDWVARQHQAGLDASFRHLFAGIRDQHQIAQLLDQLSVRLDGARGELGQLASELKLDCLTAFDTQSLNHVSLKELRSRCELWLGQLEELTRWNNYFLRARRARELGLGGLVAALETGGIQPEAIQDCFDRIYFTQMLRELIRQKPELGQFDGVIHNNHVAEFRQLDKDRLLLAKYQVLAAHYGRVPAHSGAGPAGIMRAEVERRRGHRTVRRLLKDAGSVVQAIKPVFMMSPLSVAQFLEPGAVEFDLLVIDEASQVQPVDALGAITRCKQIVVVGDSKQLPPTRFFMRLTGDHPEEEDEDNSAAQAKDIESILGLCCARGVPQAMLQWHYRSRHHTLIAVSNHEFYEDRLFIVPSPHSAAAGLGLRFHHIPNGVFDSGGSGTNREEAKVVCRAVVDHIHNTPHLSLGVAAFSIRQRQAILDELELIRRQHPDIESFFSSHPNEPFFVKNLESVQGDERDVIFISIGYGRNAQGYMAMRFGPLSNEGGERRLNVLISRAKKRCEVFSSILAEDIDLERASGRGVATLKTFLEFARTGRLGLSERSGLEEQSPFEEAVRRAVGSLGYEVHPQVGMAGFFIDLAVVDRERPGRYVLGIECDGAAYHSSRSARDRDRLRQAVLEDHGWIIHRVWSTDWFQRPQEQLRKIAEAIERAKVAVEIVPHDVPSPSVTGTIVGDKEIKRDVILKPVSSGFDGLSKPYVEASFSVPRHQEPYEVPTKKMADIVFRIIEQEGPIHEGEVVTRVRDLWGLGRAGSRIQDAVSRAIDILLDEKKCTREDGFMMIPGASVTVRDREDVSSWSLRKPEMLPPPEIRAAILALIDAHHGATGEEIPVAVARMMGFKSTGSQLREIIETQISKLVQEGSIAESDGMFKRSENPEATQPVPPS